MTIGLNNFFINQVSKKASFLPEDFESGKLLNEVLANFEARKNGYRDGVVLVNVNPANYKTSVVTLKNGDKLSGNFEPRFGTEDPRKKTEIEVESFPAAGSVEVVLYRKDVLIKGGDETTGADWDIIDILPHPTSGNGPMTPETLCHNHFQTSGGTATKMSAEEFEAALKESFLYWKDKAIGILK